MPEKGPFEGRRDLHALPKVQPHLHLAGAMRAATLAELATVHGVPVPPRLETAVGDWAQFQGRYDAAREAIRTAADVARVVAEAAADDAADGCEWMEIQVDPTGYAPVFGGYRAALEVVLAAAAAAPIPVGVIVASSWARPAAHAERLARLAAGYADAGVVGFGMSNDERLGPVAGMASAFRIAADGGLLRCPHGGFATPAGHVRDCVEVLGADRVGHGTTAAEDPAVLALLADRGVALEVCPTSYPPFGVHALDAVPVRTLLDAGVAVALGSDDPVLFGVGLAGQYEICRDVLGLSDEDLATIARHGVEHSAAPSALKASMLAGVDRWLASGPGPSPRAGQ